MHKSQQSLLRKVVGVWTPLEDFRPQIPSFVPVKIFLATPLLNCFNVILCHFPLSLGLSHSKKTKGSQTIVVSAFNVSCTLITDNVYCCASTFS